MSGEQTRDRVEQAQYLIRRAKVAEQAGAVGKAATDYDRALAMLAESPAEPLVADVLRWKGTALREVGDTAGAEDLYERSLRQAEATGYTAGRAHGLNCLAIMAQRRGELDRARRLYASASTLAEDAEQHRLVGMIEQNLGIVASIQGQLDHALTRYAASLAAFQRACDDEAASWVLNNMGMLYTKRMQFGEAETAFQRALDIARYQEDLRVEGVVEANRAAMLLDAGLWENAEEACARALQLAELRGDRLRLAEALKLCAKLERQRGAFDDSVASLERALHLARHGEDALLCAELLRELGETHARRGERAQARGAWVEALASLRAIGARTEAEELAARLETLVD